LDSSQVIERSGADEITLDALDYAASTQKVVGANDTQDVLVALVWTNPRGKAYFRAFPEQASIDGTHDTTAENWDLITLTIQDMFGCQETVMRCWAPNNRAWLFRWLFQTSIPTLFGDNVCERTRLLICDGDPQECTQLDAAITQVFVRAKRRRCGWHIVDRGWNRYFGKFIGRQGHPRRSEIDSITRLIKDWLYSLMKDIKTVYEKAA